MKDIIKKNQVFTFILKLSTTLYLCTIFIFILFTGCKKEQPIANSANAQKTVKAKKPAPTLTAKQVLKEAIKNFMKLKSYRYKGTSSMTISSKPELNSKSEFNTILVVNEEGGVDAHMVV